MSESESTLNSSCSSSDDSTSAQSDSAPTVVEPYGAEPEWTEEELVARAAQSSTDHSQDEQEEDIDVFALWPPASWIGTIDWCICGECCAMSTRDECKCCLEMTEVRAKLPSDSSGALLETCITALPKFSVVCLDVDVLNTALIGYLDLTKRPLNTTPTNE